MSVAVLAVLRAVQMQKIHPEHCDCRSMPAVRVRLQLRAALAAAPSAASDQIQKMYPGRKLQAAEPSVRVRLR